MTILKSINIVEDFASPVRASHYRPTSKSLEIVRSVIGDNGSRATSVIASYGSGKSIAAMIGALLVEGNAEKIAALEEAGLRLSEFDPVVSARLASTKAGRVRGLAIVLSGFVPTPMTAIAQVLGIGPQESMTALFRAIEEYLRVGKYDRIAFVWDEFGRHLEALSSAGRAEELAYVQDLAEWVTRRKSPSATLTLLLHQEFHRYSGRLGQSEQAVWKKIEGRFDTLRIVEDSDEIYTFIADIVAEQVTEGRPRITRKIASIAHDLGIFPFLRDEDVVRGILQKAAPLTPSALYLLPKIAGRVGQNERTIFSFLATEVPKDKGSAVGVEALYRYFSEAMRTDTGIGGTHKRFIETESARDRAKTSAEREVLAGSTLLHLARPSNSGAVSREQLAVFIELGSLHDRRAINEAIEDLLNRKLLIHRKLTDDISVWHGSDIDIRALVREKSDALRGQSNSVQRIGDLVSDPVYLAAEYNHAFKLTRFARGVFVELDDLRSPKKRAEILQRADSLDALVAMVVDGSVEDFESIRGPWMAESPHLIVALQLQRPDLDAACLEAAALTELARDEDLLGMDPLVEREIQDLRESALEYVSARASHLTDPEAGEVQWYSGGRLIGAGDEMNVSSILTQIFQTRFPQTPRISNEQIVRHKVTAQTKSARKRLLLGILERSGVDDMGYEDATSADASIYRTTLLSSGLYDPEGRSWRQPDQLSDPALGMVWSELKAFFTSPAVHPKSFSGIIGILGKPPYGIRKGLLPILVTGALRAFGEVIAIRRNVDGAWRYIDDIQPSVMEDICENPDLFEVEVVAASHDIKVVIEQMIGEFKPVPDLVETDIIRAFFDAVISWKRNLPPAALRSRNLGDEATRLQRALRQSGDDPVSLLFRALPSVAGRQTLDGTTVEFVSVARRQIERMTLSYVEEAIGASRRAFEAGSGMTTEGLLDAAHGWASQIPSAVSRDGTLDRVARGVLNRARRAKDGKDSEASFVRALSAMLTGFDFEEWDDNVARKFSRDLRARIREIEDVALDNSTDDAEIAPFIERKIEIYLEKLRAASGPAAAKSMVQRLGRTLK
ncbi:hypothetical protein [Roseicyclus marinus]|uniref:hypothetical protein n=1 Tax=Roseicyclus marinus TaxID=2161673 RepID=UPI00240FBA71|nr:hypothetical protein [Roseicyclus marinus]MDG3043129.1 hypothetical protein [Roseicyclus marinus]